MNKLTKAGIATAAGIALLMGGAGTLAYWNDQATLTGGSITAGDLTLAAGNDGAWVGPDLIVPGDDATFTQTLTLTVSGDNLDVELTVDDTDVVLPAGVTITTAFLDEDGDPIASTSFAEGVYTLTAEVTVEWEFGSAVDNSGKNATIDLAGLEIVATQV